MIMEQILLTLDLFKNKKIVHRDIKLDNILIKSADEQNHLFEIRVADFGLACITSNDEILSHKCGSPGYVAPEIFMDIGYNYKADIFSLGSVFYNLLTGMFLFSGQTVAETIRANAVCDLRHVKHFLKHTSKQCQDLLCWMLEPDPEVRPSAKKALKHPWFQEDKVVI
jgi:serine/threonine protein kinase